MEAPVTFTQGLVTSVGRIGSRNLETGVEIQKWVEDGITEWLVIVPTPGTLGHRVITTCRTMASAREDARRYVQHVARKEIAKAWEAAHGVLI